MGIFRPQYLANIRPLTRQYLANIRHYHDHKHAINL